MSARGAQGAQSAIAAQHGDAAPVAALNAWDIRQMIREELQRLLGGDVQGMVDQVRSPLGRRRHIAAVRRRMSSGECGAAIVGRRHLLSREALDSELAAIAATAKRARPAKPAPVDELADLRDRYGLERKGAA